MDAPSGVAYDQFMRFVSRAVRSSVRPILRSGWLVLTALFLAGSLDAGWGHECPHHAALPASGDTGAGVHHHHAPHAPDAPGETEHEGPCTCIGSCVVGGGAPLPANGDARVIPAIPLAGALSACAAEGPALALRFAYLLPYATAPPSIG